MSNYHLEVKTISRLKGRSVTRAASYISGERLKDSYSGKVCYNRREDVSFYKVFQPVNAPPYLYQLQHLCDEIEKAEKRYDARTARLFIASLPNELPLQELVQIVSEYIDISFLSCGLCAIAAIHEGRNIVDPARDNPHAHIIVPTRTVGPEGFCEKKDREHDKRKYVGIWRERWAEVQNRAYERNGLDIRVSHESLEVQGERDREPTIHLSRIDWQKEQRGERTIAGDQKRAVLERNKARSRHRNMERELELDLSR